MEESESNNLAAETVEGTAPDALTSNEAEDKLTALFDTPEASDTSEQAEDNVEAEPTPDEDVETPEVQFFEINGENVSLDDLKNGYLRQSDFTKKTQAIAEERKAFQENQKDVNALRVEALAGIDALKSELRAQFSTVEMPDFDWLAENDQSEFIRQSNIWQKKEAAVRQVYETEQAIRQQQEAYEAAQHEALLADNNRKFFEKYPEYRDTKKSTELFQDITSHLIERGFSKEEIESVSDYRFVEILMENVQAKKAKTAIPAAVARFADKPLLSAKQTSNKGSTKSSDIERFNKSRSGNDAVEALKNIFR